MDQTSLARTAFAMALCLCIGACSPVYLTSALDVTGEAGACGNTGAYALPKAELEFSVLRTGAVGDTSFRYEMKSGAGLANDGAAVVITPDARQKYCLDYRPNAFYSDVVRVKRSSDGLLLESVFSNVADQSKEIVEETAKAIATVAAGRSRALSRNFPAPAGSNTIAEIQMRFDPFDAVLLTQVNKALRHTGHCIYLDPTNDPYVPLWMRNQCSARKTYLPYSAKGDPEEVFNTAAFNADDGRFGVLYKPPLAHTLVILKKDDPTSAKRWRVWKREIVKMPNRAPVFMLQVRRGLFTARETEIKFDQGMLRSIEIDKKSELKALSEAIVSIAGVVVQIPAKALILRTTEAENQIALIEVNQALLEAYDTLEDAEEARANLDLGLNADGTPRSGASRAGSQTTPIAACLSFAELSNIDDPESYCRLRAGQP